MTALHTFDVWDTLLRRRCHPDEVKLHTAWHVWVRFRDLLKDPNATPWHLFRARVAAERQIAEWRQAQGLDPEYEIHEVLRKWASWVLAMPETWRGLPALAADLARRELAQELHVTYPDARGAAMVRQAGGGTIAALSDFYMPSPMLRRLLADRAPELRFDHVISSCDHMLNKQSGRLYAHLHERTGIAPDRHRHVGNSPDADVRPARALGIDAVHFRNPVEDPTAAAHHDRFTRRGPGCGVDLGPLDHEVRAACHVPTGLAGDARRLFEIGLGLAPVFVGLAMLAAEEAARVRATTVHYFTREGEFFKRVHEAIAPTQLAGVPFPRAELVEVSRIATFFPSLRAFTPAELMRVWNLYSSQSMAQLLRTFNVGPVAAEPFLARHGIDPRDRIRYPWKDARVRELLSDRHFLRLLERRQRTRRADALAHFASRGLTDDGVPRVIVDIGWRGTIQDNLAYLLPGTRLHGIYLGLQPLLNDQPANTTKTAFGPDPRRDPADVAALLRFVAPLEMVCNSGRGSIRGYTRRPDGAIDVLRCDHEDENAVHERYIRHLQEGVLAAAPLVAAWCRRHAVWSDELRPAALGRLSGLVRNPPRVLARAFFSLAHDEMFGEGGVVRKHGRLPWGLAWRARRSEKGWREFVRVVEWTNWPQGFLRLNRRRGLLHRYNAEAAAKIPAPARPTMGIIEAKRELELLEGSRAWRVVNAIKRTPVFALYARRRWGPDWDRPVEFETAEARLERLRASRTYRFVEGLHASPIYRIVTRPLRRRKKV
ncbi:MAG: hypothetical protein ACKVU4_02845 [Phycisphaerales bacterium]